MGEQDQGYYRTAEGEGAFDGADIPSVPRHVGEYLRDARRGTGLELSQVAETLRIRLVFLAAIEEGRFSDLPGPTYASGFLRSYAEFLGLDPTNVIARYKGEIAGDGRKAELYFPTPVPENRNPAGAILLVAVILVGAVYGGWLFLSAHDRSLADLVPALPDRFTALLDQLPWTQHSADGAAAVEATVAPADLPPLPGGPAPVATGTAPGSAMTGPAMTASLPAVPPPPALATQPSPATSADVAGGLSGSPASAATASATTPPPAPMVVPAPVVPSTPVPPMPPISRLAGTPPSSPAGPAAGTAMAPTTAPMAAPTTPAAPATVTPPAASRVVVDATPANAPADDGEGAPQDPTPIGANAAAQPQTDAAATTDAATRAPSPPLPQGRTYGTQNRNSHMAIRAHQDAWVQIRDGGEVLFTRVLRPGDTYRLPDRPGLKLRTGNAGGLFVVKNGEDGASLGEVGQVLRDFPIDGSQ